MILLRTLVCAACCVIVLSVRTPTRVLQVRAQDNQHYQVAGYPSYNDAAADERARHFGASKVQSTVRLDNEIMNAVRLDVTTYAPRPTTSMPQSRLRSLCLTPRGKFPHPLDCRKYVDCWDGRVLEKRCPNDLVFSDLPGEFCDYLEYVDCGNRPVLLDNNEQVVAVANLPIPAPPQAPTTRPPPPPPAAFAKWVAASNGALPDSAVPSGGVIIRPGTTDQSMFVGRALVDGNVLPCTLVPKAPVQGCYVAWNNAENLYKQYEVLQSNGAKWIPMTSNSTIPSNAIPTGLLDVSPIQRMYTGRAVIGDSLVPGYISDSNKVLIQTRQGSTFYATNYELLVLNK